MKVEQYDTAFKAFLMISALAEELMPNVRHYTLSQTAALHKHAELIAAELTKPCYVYSPKYDAAGNYIPQEKRTPVVHPSTERPHQPEGQHDSGVADAADSTNPEAE